MFLKFRALLNVLWIFVDYEWRLDAQSDVLTHRCQLPPEYCLISIRVLYIRNCAKFLNLATIRRIQRGEGWFVFPLFLLNALGILTTEQLLLKWSWTIRVRRIIHNLSIFSGEDEKYHYAVKFIAIFSMFDTKQISRLSAFDSCKWNYHTIYLKSFIEL